MEKPRLEPTATVDSPLKAKPVAKAPAKRGRPAGVRTAPSLEKSLVDLLTGFNTPLVMLAAFGRLPEDDPLNEDEIKKLAHALDVQARRTPAFGKWLARFVAGGESLGLVAVAGGIIGKRVINHLPENVLSGGKAEQIKAGLGAAVDFSSLLEAPTGEASDQAPV